MEAYTKNASDETQVSYAETKVKSGKDREENDFRNVMASPSGRRVVYRYIAECGVFQDSFTGNNTTFYNEGKRSIGLRLLSDCNEYCPDLYWKMMSESKVFNK